MSTKDSMDRRRFLAQATRIALGSACAYATMGRLQLVQAAVGPAPAEDFRALVCVFLFGGNDSFNMVVPRGTSEHAGYAAARPNLTIARDSLLPINPLDGDGRSWGLHPNMPELQALFEQGTAALVPNVGPLVVPTTLADFQAQRVPLPPELFSHVDQQAAAMSLGSEVEARPGWGGRIADRLAALGPAGGLPPNISLAGANSWQAGASSGLYSMTGSGVIRLDSTLRSTTSSRWINRRAAFDRIRAAASADGSVFVREQGRKLGDAIDYAEFVNDAINGVPLTTVFPGSGLGSALRQVARMIGARQVLGQRRQVFFVSLGGFDTHDNMLTDHGNLMATLSQGLAAFHAATVELGVADKVTSFSMTDFGRTLNNNGDGTDHGWGGHSWVLGGDVVGRRFYGQMPDMVLGSAQDAGRGRMIPTTSIDQLGGSLSRWLGLGYGDTHEIFPNLRNFGRDYLPMLASTNALLEDVGFTRKPQPGGPPRRRKPAPDAGGRPVQPSPTRGPVER